MELSNTAEQDVRELELGRFRAMIEADRITLARMFADELAYGHSDGGFDTKASLIDKIASGHLDYLDIQNPDLKVAVVGETAIVTGRMVAMVTSFLVRVPRVRPRFRTVKRSPTA